MIVFLRCHAPRLQLGHFFPKPLDLKLLRLHLSLTRKRLCWVRTIFPDPLAQDILMNIQIAGSAQTPTPRSRTNLTASSLYSRLNFLRCIHALQFHWKHLNSVSRKRRSRPSAKARVRPPEHSASWVSSSTAAIAPACWSACRQCWRGQSASQACGSMSLSLAS